MKYCFGKKLREIRKKKKITMKELSLKVGVSESLISQIETDKVSPAVDTLLKISYELNIDFEYLFKNYKKKSTINIIRKENRKIITDGPAKYELLSKIDSINKENAIEAYYLKLSPGKTRNSNNYGHPGRELGIIVEGTGKITVSGSTYSISKGDSVSFNSDEPHTLINTGETILKAYWITTPPKNF